jgi:hypothetical protein|tara:strand:+ start:2727 stop:2942 length:216 start_codon:yes stop_codon:yes gene_type:complete
MNKKINKLHQLLIDNLIMDLNDVDKCTPGLYQVVRGVLTDNKELLDSIPQDTLDFLEDKLTDSLPFKKEAS